VKLPLAAPLLAALLLLGASGSAEQTALPSPRVTQTVLGNGLRVVVVENHVVPLANVAMWYRIGSADDPPGHTGLAHALEHMMFRGTHALSGAGIDLVHARLGIDANAETDYESTHYYQTVPVDALAVALHIEADRMHGLTLRPRDWELERGAVLAELSADQSSASTAIESAVRRAAYGRSPFAHDPAGTERDVLRTTVADLRRAYEAAYQPDNATLVVTGDVAPDVVVRLARTLFGPLRGHARIAHPRATAPLARGFTVRLSPFDTRVVDVALAVHGERASDSAAEEVTAELLGPEHAPLRDTLTGADGPCASYEIDDDRVLDGGLYHVVCRLKSLALSRDAIGTIRRALKHLAAHPPSANDVAYARRADVANAAFTRDSLSGEADYFGGNIAVLRTDPRRWEADTVRVSNAAVAAVLRRWADPVGYGIALAGNVTVTAGVPDRRERLEHVAPVAEGAAIEPAWARVAPHGLRTDDVAAVDTFALANGVRVFVQPRRGNGTVYVRAGFDGGRAGRFRAARFPELARFAEAHAIMIDDGDDGIGMHGFSTDLLTMLRLIDAHMRAAPRTVGDNAAPEHAWIAVTGDADPDAVRARAGELFGGWHVTARPEPSASPRPSPAPMKAPRLSRPFVVRVGTASVRALLMQRAPDSDDPDRGAMALLDEVLGANGDLDARLGTEVRRRRGLAYMVGSYYDADHGRFFVMFEAPHARFRAARTAVRDVLHALQTTPITSEELDRARHKLVAAALQNESTPTGVLDRLSAAARNRQPPDDLQSIAARYDAVTLDDVRRVARTRLTPNAMMEIDEGPVP
jgi:predicted Zn-dependent peptidase